MVAALAGAVAVAQEPQVHLLGMVVEGAAGVLRALGGLEGLVEGQ